jgi:hypothetical protein
VALKRNALVAALTDALTEVAEFKTISRVFREIAPEEQPALFVRITSEKCENDGTKPRPFWILGISLVVYVYADSEEGAAVPLQDLIDSIEARLLADKTLGGAAVWARINGQFEIREGEGGREAFCSIPLELAAIA